MVGAVGIGGTLGSPSRKPPARQPVTARAARLGCLRASCAETGGEHSTGVVRARFVPGGLGSMRAFGAVHTRLQ